MVYRSDGAARGQGARGSTGDASYGAVRIVNGSVVGQCGGLLQEATNNVAEYCGMIACVNDACYRLLGNADQSGGTLCVFQLDSMLVTKHGNFQWRCLSLSLASYYEHVMASIRRLQDSGISIKIMHIYREFNTLADGLANEVLNMRSNVLINWCANVP